MAGRADLELGVRGEVDVVAERPWACRVLLQRLADVVGAGPVGQVLRGRHGALGVVHAAGRADADALERADVHAGLLGGLLEHAGHARGDRLRAALERRLVALGAQHLVVRVRPRLRPGSSSRRDRCRHRCHGLQSSPCGVILVHMDVWCHDRWGIPLPAGHRFPISKYGLLRERVEAAGLASVREAEPVPWDWLAEVHDAALLERIRVGHADIARAARAGAALVGGAGGARAPLGRRDARRGAAGAGAGDRHEPGRRDAPRGARLRPRLLPVQRRRVVTSRGCGPRAWPGGRWWWTATSTRATARPNCSGPTRRRSRCRCTARATTRSSASRPTSTSTCRPARATPPTWPRSRTPWTRRPPPTSPSIWPAPTRGRATASAGCR